MPEPLSPRPTWYAGVAIEDYLGEVLVALDAERAKTERLRIETVEGVLDLMRDAGTLQEHPDTIIPHGNGYSCWFIARGQLGTAPLRAEEIVRRIDARAFLASGEGGTDS